MTPTALLDALCDPPTMRLMMGELTVAELALAQAVVRSLPEQLQARGLAMVPVEPAPALLFSIAMRWDHAIGMDGYHDTFQGPGAHARIKGELLERAERVHRALVRPQVHDRDLHAALQQGLEEGKSPEDRLIVASALTYALAHARQRGMAIVPRELTQELTETGLEALASELKEPQDRSHVVLDLKRFWEEVSGEGFYRGERPTPPNPPAVKPR